MTLIPGQESVIERLVGGGEIEAADQGQCLWRALLTIHPIVLPLDRQRALVTDVIQRAENALERDTAPPGRDKKTGCSGTQ